MTNKSKPVLALSVVANAVPTNWCDPLLTGPDGLGGPPYTCRDVEKLLRGIQDRIRALGDTQLKGRKS